MRNFWRVRAHPRGGQGVGFVGVTGETPEAIKPFLAVMLPHLLNPEFRTLQLEFCVRMLSAVSFLTEIVTKHFSLPHLHGTCTLVNATPSAARECQLSAGTATHWPQGRLMCCLMWRLRRKRRRSHTLVRATRGTSRSRRTASRASRPPLLLARTEPSSGR